MGDRVFIVGPNASGKSNFLDAFRFLHDLAKPRGGGLQYAVEDRRHGLKNVRCLAARSDPEVEIDVEVSDFTSETPLWRYQLAFNQQQRGKHLTVLTREIVWRNGIEVYRRPKGPDRKDETRLTQTSLEQVHANVEFRELQEFFSSINYLHLVPQLLRHPHAFGNTPLPDDPYGQNFLNVVARTPEKNRRSRLKKISEVLNYAVPQLTELQFSKDETGMPHLIAVYEHWRSQGVKHSEDQFSDGTLRLIGLLWVLFEGDSPLLLEEPEMSLHSAIVQRLPGMMHRIQRIQKRSRQIIVSTHSPELLSDKGIGGEEVLLLTPDAEGTNVVVASTLNQIKDLLESGISPADAIMPMTSPKAITQLDLSNWLER
jgi:predicted ATPase